MGREVKLTQANGKHVSAKSKTGDPACSQAMSDWVRGRKSGGVSGVVFAILAKCRGKARQNKQAKAKEAAGKVAPGRGTWQRSEKAAQLHQARAANRPAPAAAPSAAVARAQAAAQHAAKPAGAPRAPAPAVAAAVAGLRAVKEAAHPSRRAEVNDRIDAHLDGMKDAQVIAAHAALTGGKASRRTDAARGIREHVLAGPADPAARARVTRATADAARAARRSIEPRAMHDRQLVRAYVARIHGPGGTHRELMGGHMVFNGSRVDAHRPIVDEAVRRGLVNAMPQGRPGHVGYRVSPRGIAAAGIDFARNGRRVEQQHEGFPRARAALERASKAVHAANPAAPGTVHHAPESVHQAGGFSLAPPPSRLHNNGADAFFDSGKGHGKRAPLFGLEDLPTNSARGQGSLFGGKMHDAHAGTSGTTGRSVVVGADGVHRLPGDFGARTTTRTANLSAAPRPAEAAPSGGKLETREGRLAGLLGKARARLARKAEAPANAHETPGFVGDLAVARIHADPERFQYKAGATETGSVGSLAGVRKWDPDLGGVVQVWHDKAAGKTFVVNGHNRLDLAKKLGADKILVRHIVAKDAEQARSIGALTNIAEGRGTATDAAKFFRDSTMSRADIEARGIPLREKVATEGLALSTLHKSVFDKVVSGHITEARGAIIGAAGLNHDQQKQTVALMDEAAKKSRAGEITNAHLKEIVDDVKHSGTVETKTHSLFGDDVEEKSLALHRTKLQAYIKEKLGKEKRLFGIVSKSRHAEDLARANNSIDTAKSAEVSHEAAVTLQAFDTFKRTTGPVSKALNRGAQRLHAGHGKAAYEEAYRSVLKHVPRMLNGGF